MQQGRHSRRLSSPTTWVAAAVAACLAGVVVLSTAPAEARSATVPVQLTLSGIASPDNPTGGAVVGVHPGDSVVLTPSAIPTAGAPAGLADGLAGLLSGVAGLQVKITKGNLPGVKYPFTLGKVANCPGGNAKLTLASLAKGTYSFKYEVFKVSVLTSILGTVTGCQTTQVTPTKDQLGALTANQVKVTDHAVYSGSIVAATNPPKGQVGIQLPSQSVSVKAGPISTSVNIPGATLTVPNPVPGITSKVGGVVSSVVNRVTGGAKSTPAKGGASVPNVKYTPPALTVPQKVMPHAVNVGGAAGTGTAGGFAAPGGNGQVGPRVVAPAATSTAPNPNATTAASSAATKPAGKSVDLADRTQLGGQQLPALLAIAAILALSLVTAAYARIVLIRRRPSA